MLNMGKDVLQSEIQEPCDDFDDSVKTIMPPPEPDSLETLMPPPKSAEPVKACEKPEITWDYVARLYRDKIEIWIKKNSGCWDIGRIVDLNEEKQRLTVEWVDLEHPFGHMAKNISLDTYAEWIGESPEED
jgi:hypothetical protein